MGGSKEENRTLGKDSEISEIQVDASTTATCKSKYVWSKMSSGIAATLKGVWGEENDKRVWAVGQNGVILELGTEGWHQDEMLGIDVLDSVQGNQAYGVVTVGTEVMGIESETFETRIKLRVYQRKEDVWIAITNDLNGVARHVLLDGELLYVMGENAGRGRVS